jgi:hypothetical protein
MSIIADLGLNTQAIVNGAIGAVIAVAVARSWTRPADTISILICGIGSSYAFDVPFAEYSHLDLKACQVLLGMGGMAVCQTAITGMRNLPFLRTIPKSGDSNGDDKS